MSWVMRLAEAVDWRPLDLDVSWNEIEERLGSRLPVDFKQFCEVFGRGDFCDGLFVYSTDGGAALEVLDELALLQQLAETFPLTRLDPYGLYAAGGGGLIPWGRVTQGHSFYWLAGQSGPDEWPVMMGVETGEWERFDVSMSEFIFRVFTDANFGYNIAGSIGRPYYRPIEGQG